MVLAAAAVLAGCQKESPRDRNFKVVQPTVFTATMEDVVETRTTFNPTDLRISWETGDRVNINGNSFISQSAGASTTFKGYCTIDVLPEFVSSPSGGFQNQDPSMLVDSNMGLTKWCANNDHKGGDAWTIIVSTDEPSRLQAIKLWNGDDTQQHPERRWKNVTVSGSASASGPWEEIKPFRNLDLAANNGGLAGILSVDATASYQYYKIEISAIMGGDVMQMSSMKFLILDEKGTMPSPYTAYFPETLIGNGYPMLQPVISETWEEGKFNMPMYAYSTSRDLQFKNLCGMLKVVVKKDVLASVRSITVSSSNCATSGKFSVNDDKAVLTYPESISNTLTINYKESVPTSSEGTAFYVPIPAQTYRDLEITMTDDAAILRRMTMKSGEDFVVERNRIYTINFAADDRGVDLGLSVNWATCNLGASKPEEYGGYYQWAGTEDVTSTDIYLDWSNCPYHTGSDYKPGWTKYISSDYQSYWSGAGSPDNKLRLEKSDDVAHIKLGGRWRIPTEDEWCEMWSNCDYGTATLNGVFCIKFTSKKNGNSIFLPAAGCRRADYAESVGSHCSFWASNLITKHPNYACGVEFHLNGYGVSSDYRYVGRSVRPVSD